jgi:hypothetical protein
MTTKKPLSPASDPKSQRSLQRTSGIPKAGRSFTSVPIGTEKQPLDQNGSLRRQRLVLRMLIVLLGGLLSLVSVVGGIMAANGNSKTSIDLFGLHVTTGDVGVAFVALGLMMGYFIIRAVLRSLRES